jgi:hypothetical protein
MANTSRKMAQEYPQNKLVKGHIEKKSLSGEIMEVRNYNHGRFFGPSSSFAGYVLIAAGIIALSNSFLSIVLIIPGIFTAFTYTGTLLDTDNKRLKPYNSLFGIIRTGKWIDVKEFTRFNIIRATRKYTSYSRANVSFDMNISDIRLLLINKDGTRKVVINRYNKFENAQVEKDRLSPLLFPEKELTVIEKMSDEKQG